MSDSMQEHGLLLETCASWVGLWAAFPRGEGCGMWGRCWEQSWAWGQSPQPRRTQIVLSSALRSWLSPGHLRVHKIRTWPITCFFNWFSFFFLLKAVYLQVICNWNVTFGKFWSHLVVVQGGQRWGWGGGATLRRGRLCHWTQVRMFVASAGTGVVRAWEDFQKAFAFLGLNHCDFG